MTSPAQDCTAPAIEPDAASDVDPRVERFVFPAHDPIINQNRGVRKVFAKRNRGGTGILPMFQGLEARATFDGHACHKVLKGFMN